jgi:hypothetical protein
MTNGTLTDVSVSLSLCQDPKFHELFAGLCTGKVVLQAVHSGFRRFSGKSRLPLQLVR